MTRRGFCAGLAGTIAIIRPAGAESLEYLCFFRVGAATVTDRCRRVVQLAAAAWDRERLGQEHGYLDPNGPALPARTMRLEIRGYAPDSADAAGRARLGLARVRAVADELRRRGVPDADLSAVGLADRDMLVPDSPDEPQNHRAQIVFLP